MNRRRWWIGGALGLIAVLVISAGVAWYARSGLVRWLAIRQLGTLTNRQATIERLDVDPVRGRIEISGLRLADRAPGPALAEIDQLDVRFDPLALLRGRIIIREATLGGVRARIVRSERGELNIADLLARAPAPGSTALTVDRLTLTGGAVSLEDRARTPIHTWRADAIAMEMSHLSTTSSDTQGAGRLTATVGEAPVSAEVSELRLAPLHLRGRLALKDVDATVAGIALSADMLAVVERARLTANLSLSVDARDGIRLDADGRLDGLALRNRRNADPLAEVPSLAFTVSGARSDASGHTPTLGRIEVTGAATLFDARGSASGRFEVDRLRLQIADVEGSTPASARTTLTAGLPGGGSLDVQGPLRLAPLGAELRARVTQMDPGVLMSYADLPVILAGVVESDLTLDVAYAGTLTARVRGRSAVSRATVTDGGRQVASARRIEVDGIEVDRVGSRPPRIGVARVRVIQPTAILERDQAGRIPLADRFAPAPASPGRGAAARTAPAPSGLSVAVAEIAVDDGAMTLDDAASVPPARLTLAKLRGSARNVEWPPRGPVTIDLQGAMPGAGTIEAKGAVSLDPVRLDVRARLAGAALAPYQGYVPLPARIQGSVDADVAVAGTFGPEVKVTAKGTAALSKLSMADGDRQVLRVSRVETAGLDYTWPSTLAVDRLRVGRSRVRVERQADGAVPLRAIFTQPRTPPGATAGPDAARAPGGPAISVTVREALLEDGAARITDATVHPASRIDLSGVRLVAHGFTWPAQSPMPIELRVGTPGGGSASARGTLDLASAGVDLNLAVAGVDLAPAQAYLPLRGNIAAKASGDLEVKARLEPLSIAVRGNASLADLAITERARPVIAVARVETTGLDYTWPATVAIDRLRVQKPRAMVERQRDGTLPLLALLTAPTGLAPATTARAEPSSTGSAPSVPALDLSIRESVLEDGSATVTDAAVSPPARFEVTGVRLVARNFTWPSRGPTSVRLRAPMPGGGTVRAQGQLGAAAAGLDLDVTLDGVDVATARPYLPLRGQVAGKASARLKMSATMEPLALTARGTASVADLAVTDGGQRLLTAALAEVTRLDYTWPTTVSIDRLRVQKPWAMIERVSGKLPLLEALAPPGSTGDGAVQRPTPAASAAASAPELRVRRSVIEDGAATIIDASVSPAARLDITGARVALRDFAWPSRGPSGFVARAATRDGGTLEARGQLRLDPSSIDTKLVLDRVDLATLSRFVPGRVHILGKATADLQIKGPLAPLALSVTGQMALIDASLGDGERALATAKSIDLGGLAIEWPRRRATIQRIRVREPWALVERDANGMFPLLSLVTPGQPDGAAPATEHTAPAATPDNNAARIEVGTLAVEEGFVRFTDRTTTPRFVEEASHLRVTARGLGTAPTTRSALTVGARLTGGAHVELSGVMGPLGGPLFADVTGKLSGLPLDRVNPYVNGLLGWIARQGSVTTTTRFRIHDDHLEAENEVVIGRPQFVPSRRGDEVRQRVGVPLDLLVSLLENARREVHLLVPVTGTISSRQFDFGDAVWDAIRKAAISVLALPVSLVGKIFYTADSRIDTISIWPVSFEPGTTTMRRGIDTHATRLATFMRETPAVAFTMKPVMTVEDVDALKRDAVRNRLDALTRSTGQPDVATVATRLFTERFPGQAVPADPDTMVNALARQEPSPDGALRALATQRVDLTRHELEGKGVDPARLRTGDGTVPVEASGPGRVEFEMAPLASPAS